MGRGKTSAAPPCSGMAKCVKEKREIWKVCPDDVSLPCDDRLTGESSQSLPVTRKDREGNIMDERWSERVEKILWHKLYTRPELRCSSFITSVSKIVRNGKWNFCDVPKDGEVTYTSPREHRNTRLHRLMTNKKARDKKLSESKKVLGIEHVSYQMQFKRNPKRGLCKRCGSRI